MKKYKFVLAGYGEIAKKHLEVFKDLGVFFSASCNRSKEKREEAKQVWRIPNTYMDVEEMVEKENPDGILITTSFMENHKVAKRLIKYGIPILLEKPPALSIEETNELIEISLRYNTKIMIGFNRRFYSIYHKLLELIGGKEKINYVYIEWSEDPILLKSLGKSNEEISKYIYANSLHGIDMILFFVDNLDYYNSWGKNLSNDYLSFQMAFFGENQKGTKANFYSNWDVPGRWRLLIDSHNIRAISAPLETINILSRSGTIQIDSSAEDKKFKPGFYGQAKYFLEIVTSNKVISWPACSIEDSLKSIKLAEELTDKCLQNQSKF